jgi:hypothetical protein
MGELILFDSHAALPAHIAKLFGGKTANNDLSSGVSTSFPIISIKGKVFHIVQGDDRRLVTNDDGDAKGSIDVVILKANPAISKVYYATGYVEGSDAKPSCYSNDGVAPAKDASEPQSHKCAVCPHNIFGSRVSENGAKGKACADSRRLAVAAPNDLENPMLLRIPAGTLKELTAYAEILNKKDVPYRALVTKIGFDHDVAHQKLTFTPKRFLTADEAEQVIEVLESSTVADIIGAQPTLDIPGTPPAALMRQETKKTESKPVKPYVATESEVAEVLDKPKPSPKPTLVQTEAKPAAKPAAKAAAKPKPAPVVVEESESLDDILASLDNDD